MLHGWLWGGPAAEGDCDCLRLLWRYLAGKALGQLPTRLSPSMLLHLPRPALCPVGTPALLSCGFSFRISPLTSPPSLLLPPLLMYAQCIRQAITVTSWSI